MHIINKLKQNNKKTNNKEYLYKHWSIVFALKFYILSNLLNSSSLLISWGIKSYKKHENFMESEDSSYKIIKMHFIIINKVFIIKKKKDQL